MSEAYEQQNHSSYFGEGAGISRAQAIAHCLAFYGGPWHLWACALARVLQRVYNEAQDALEDESSVVLDLISSNS